MNYPIRKPNRLKTYDYAQVGAYFVTVCVQDMRCLLSTVVGDPYLIVGEDGDARHDARRLLCNEVETERKDLGLPSTDANTNPLIPHVCLTAYGRIIADNLERMNGIYTNIQVDHYVIMPNHVHLLISVKDDDSCGRPGSASPTTDLTRFVAAFKKYTNKACGFSVWQRSFHDHVIRDDADYRLHWRYIDENPKKWLMGKDAYYS